MMRVNTNHKIKLTLITICNFFLRVHGSNLMLIIVNHVFGDVKGLVSYENRDPKLGAPGPHSHRKMGTRCVIKFWGSHENGDPGSPF